MKTFAINTLGCKVNQYESQQIRELLTRLALTEASDPTEADLVIINTCCVTGSASAKSRNLIRKAQRQNATTVVAGCLPIAGNDELKNIKGNIRIIGRKSDLAPTIAQITGRGYEKKSHTCYTNKTTGIYIKPQTANKIKHKNAFTEDSFSALPPITAFKGRSRAFLKIQDGCDGYCTYCIIPQIRTNVCNKNVKSVLDEAKTLIRAGHREIVLTGVFLGAYGHNTVRRKKWEDVNKDKLAMLLDKLAQLPGLKRLRLSSLEPADVTEKLLDTFCKHPNIAPHLHLPLQSGSEKILKKMRRQYTAGDFFKTIQRIKSRLDRPAVTTDIIVGFPGETDKDFAETLKLAKNCGFAKMHVFPFSLRKNTSAAEMTPAVKSEIIKERSKTLRNLDKQLAEKFRAQFAGEKVSVIVEDIEPMQGRVERYFMVKLDQTDGIEKPKKGDYIQAKLNKTATSAVVFAVPLPGYGVYG